MPRGIYPRKPKIDHDSLTTVVIKKVLNGNKRHATPISIKRIHQNLPHNVERMLGDIKDAIIVVDRLTRRNG